MVLSTVASASEATLAFAPCAATVVVVFASATATPDQLLGLAKALNVSVEDLVGSNGTKKRGTGPTGKMKQLFEAASQLPRSQ